MTPICAIDTETDGTHRKRSTWEVAMIRRDEHGERTSHFFVDINLADSDPFGLNIGRFYDRHPLGLYLSGKSTERPYVVGDLDDWFPDDAVIGRTSAAYEVARFTHGAHIVGAIPSFEMERDLSVMLWDAGLAPAWHHHIIDVEAMAVGWLNAKGHGIRPPWKSDDLTELLGLESLPADQRHTAMGDARWALGMYDAMVPADS